jgi:hypothetical protein
MYVFISNNNQPITNPVLALISDMRYAARDPHSTQQRGLITCDVVITHGVAATGVGVGVSWHAAAAVKAAS